MVNSIEARANYGSIKSYNESVSACSLHHTFQVNEGRLPEQAALLKSITLEICQQVEPEENLDRKLANSQAVPPNRYKLGERKKRPSVEFSADVVIVSCERIEPGRQYPRRLTQDEKADLYELRPDLCMPSPRSDSQYYQGHDSEERKRNVTLGALAGTSLAILLVLVYFLLTPE